MGQEEYRSLMLEMMRDLKSGMKDLDNKIDDLKEKFHAHCEESKTQQLNDARERLKQYTKIGGLTLSSGGMGAGAVVLLKWILTGDLQ